MGKEPSSQFEPNRIKRQVARHFSVNSTKGFSLVEVMVLVGIMSLMMFAMMTMQSNQMKSNNFLEFQLKRTQLQGTLIGQVLKDANNCGCIFQGATEFPVAGIATLAGVTPTQIGLYNPGCGAPTQVFIDGTTAGIDGLRLTSISLQSLKPTGDPNTYSAFFNVNIQSTKEVAGPRDLSITPIPVSISTTPSGGNVSFVNCSTTSGSAGTKGIVGTEGWVRRPDGLLEQWGYQSAASWISGKEYPITISYSKPFADTNYSLILTTVVPAGSAPYDNYAQEISGTRTTTGVTVFSQDPSGGGSAVITAVRWHAIGL
jgi:hypothetical protein